MCLWVSDASISTLFSRHHLRARAYEGENVGPRTSFRQPVMHSRRGCHSGTALRRHFDLELSTRHRRSAWLHRWWKPAFVGGRRTSCTLIQRTAEALSRRLKILSHAYFLAS